MQGKAWLLAMSRGSRGTDSQGDQAMLFLAGFITGLIVLMALRWLVELTVKFQDDYFME